MLGRKDQPKKYYMKHTCGECEFRNYGTDTHYVCYEGDTKDVWFRVRRKDMACPKFRKKYNG